MTPRDPEFPTVTGLAEVMAEAGLASTATGEVSDLVRRRNRDIKRRSASTDSPARSELIDQPWAFRLSALGRTAFLNIAWFEENLPKRFDHSPLIVLGSKLLEFELNRLIGEPLRELDSTLIEGGEIGGLNPKQMRILHAWQGAKCPTTLGVLETLIYAWKKACSAELAPACTFLMERFVSPFESLLLNGKLVSTLGTIRDGYRNRAVHDLRTWNEQEYSKFCKLLLGNARFEAWGHSGSISTMPKSSLLHSFVSHSRPHAWSTESMLLWLESNLVATEPSRVSVLVRTPANADAEPEKDGDNNVQMVSLRSDLTGRATCVFVPNGQAPSLVSTTDGQPSAELSGSAAWLDYAPLRSNASRTEALEGMVSIVVATDPEDAPAHGETFSVWLRRLESKGRAAPLEATSTCI